MNSMKVKSCFPPRHHCWLPNIANPLTASLIWPSTHWPHYVLAPFFCYCTGPHPVWAMYSFVLCVCTCISEESQVRGDYIWPFHSTWARGNCKFGGTATATAHYAGGGEYLRRNWNTCSLFTRSRVPMWPHFFPPLYCVGFVAFLHYECRLYKALNLIVGVMGMSLRESNKSKYVVICCPWGSALKQNLEFFFFSFLLFFQNENTHLSNFVYTKRHSDPCYVMLIEYFSQSSLIYYWITLTNFLQDLEYPTITYYWRVPLILDHSYLFGNLTNSKIAETKALETLESWHFCISNFRTC
jgi:hypothetical protein